MKIRSSSRGTLRTIYNIFALIIVTSILGTGLPSAQARAELGVSFNTKALAQAVCTDSGRGSEKLNNGKDSFIGTEHGKPIRVNPSFKHGSASDAAQVFLSECAGVLSAQGQNSDFVVMREDHSNIGNHTSVKFQQTYQGIPVLAGEKFVQMDDNQDVLAVGGETLANINLDVNPSLNAAAAQSAARDYVAGVYNVDAATLTATEPELWIYNPSLLTPSNGPTVLVWRMDVRSADHSLPINQLTLVDAHSGAMALSFNQEEFAYETIIINSGNDTNVSNDVPVCYRYDNNPDPNAEDFNTTDTLPNCNNGSVTGGDAITEAVQNNLQTSYNYFLHVLQHDGPNGDGKNGGSNIINVFVHYGNNNYYDQTNGEMIFGNGTYNGSQLDVVSHEYAHSVINNTANLFPYYQSGAIGESIADVFGEVIQHANGYGDGLAFDWSVAGRSMSNPTVKTMTDLGNYFTNNPSKNCLGTKDGGGNQYDENCDNGGIHAINGVNDYAAYLLGSSFWSPEQVTALYYEALRTGLTSGSDYPALAAALRQACTNLEDQDIGDGTFFITPISSANNHQDCTNLDSVLISTGMDNQPTANGSPDAPYCDDPTFSRDITFADDMEDSAALSTNWIVNGWQRVPQNASNGTHSLHADDMTLISSTATLENKNGVSIASTVANAFLYFKQYYAFDDGGTSLTNYDGGILEYATSPDGTTWSSWSQVDQSLMYSGTGYNGVINGPSSTNPLVNTLGFVRDSHGYVGTRVDVTSLKGQQVKFRWKMGTDASGYDLGWYVDDVSVYSCVDIPVINYITSFYKSVKAQDGFMTESSENSNLGGGASATVSYMNIGDNSADKQLRGLVSFNTSALPDTAVITNLNLCLRKYTLTGNNDPFTWGNGFRVDVKNGYYNNKASLVAGDFQALSSATNIGTFSSTPTTASSTCGGVTGWYAASVTSGGLYVNLAGTTQFKIYFNLDDNDDRANDYLRFYAGENLTYAPRLVVTYYIP